MQPKTTALLAGMCLLAAGLAVLVPSLLESDDVPVMTWDAADEVEVADEAAPLTSEDPLARTQLEAVSDNRGDQGADERIAMLLRGRVVDRFQAPVPGAKVFLDFGRGGQRDRGGRTRRVPDPVVTGSDGTFAFQGELFRNLRVELHVVHTQHAPGQFERDLGQATAEMTIGDLVLDAGSAVVGRVTDLDGFGIPEAEVRQQPEGGNRLRRVRDRDELLPARRTDRNGFFQFPHVAAGEWRVAASAKRHQNGQSSNFETEEAISVELDDIRLGPGYELSGLVHDTKGKPVAKASVSLRAPRGGRDFRTDTDAQGRFFVEHLPGTPLDLTARGKGYLEHEQSGIDPTQQSAPLQIVLQDGLRITGVVVDAASGQPVTQYAVRANRLRGLPRQADAAVQQAIESAMRALREGNGDPGALRVQFEDLRVEFERNQVEMNGLRQQFRNLGDMGGGRGQAWGGLEQFGSGNWFQGDLGQPQDHPAGRFELPGLQEGIYAVEVQSPDHTRWRSAEIELRVHMPAPEVAVSLDRGLTVRGTVTDGAGRPIANADVQLRTVAQNDGPRQDPRGGGRDGMGNMFRQFFGNGTQVGQVRSDARGHFAVAHAPAGRYRIVASADKHDEASSEPFDLQTDIDGIALTLGALASLEGRVLGLPTGVATEARVVAFPMGGQFSLGRRSNRLTEEVKEDGTYLFEGLRPGDYVVRAVVGSTADLFRELMPMLQASNMQADVVLEEGKVARLDVTVQLPKTGKLVGTVTNNGIPAKDHRVELRSLEENSPPGDLGAWGRFGRRSLGASTGPAGRYAIDNVPAGLYELTVSSGRRGGTLYQQQVSVIADTDNPCDVTLITCGVKGRVVDAEDPTAELQGNVSFLPGLTELPQDFNAWRRENPSTNARVQNGVFESDALAPGQYLMLVNVRGRERVTQSIFLTAGAQVQVDVPAGKKQPARPAGETGGARPGQRGGRGGGR